jgi:hypothetical protein
MPSSLSCLDDLDLDGTVAGPRSDVVVEAENSSERTRTLAYDS